MSSPELDHNVIEKIASICAGEDDAVTLMAVMAAELYQSVDGFDWVGFYHVAMPGVLKLGPYQGGHGCLVIPFDKGVCGAAARYRKTQIVHDVSQFDGHIACSASTQSELVIPVFDRHDNLLAVLDIDSDQPGFFTKKYATQLEDLLTRLFFCPGRGITDFASDEKLGASVPNWTAPASPDKVVSSDQMQGQMQDQTQGQMQGQHVRLEPLVVADHCDDLFAAFAADSENRNWDYLPYGPFASAADLASWMANTCSAPDPYFFAIIDQTSNRATGVASYLRINPQSGSIEVGHINFAPVLQATIGATEAMYMMMRWAFEAGYRRYEWKCNALNMRSRRAAQRLGLSYEGVFRQATVSKGRNRDTAWFASIDAEWPALKAAFEAWLQPANFDATGGQRQSLSALTAGILALRDPVLAR
jgi:putative methionine-R-sulfoxide reductase with GAF domain/RimJ/RimL family protein N-acetyltransferase